jgi:hypothetical protein
MNNHLLDSSVVYTWINEFVKNPLAIITAVLVGITGFYAWQTKRTVDSLEKSTKYQFLPYIKLYLGMLGPQDLDLRIKNVGKGPAKDLDIQFHIKEKGEVKRTWRQQLLVPSDFISILVPNMESKEETGIEYFENNQTTIIVSAAYRDVFDKAWSNEETIDITAYVMQFKKTRSLFREEPLERIARNVEGISRETKNMHYDLRRISGEISEHEFQRRVGEQIHFALKRIQELPLPKEKKDKLVNQVEILAVQFTRVPLMETEIRQIMEQIKLLDEEASVVVATMIPYLKRFG